MALSLTITSSKSNRSLLLSYLSKRKRDIRLEFYEDATVYCIGELVMATSGTKQEYVVDVWSGNHPFYLGNRSGVLVDADQVEKFRKKLGELSQIMGIPVLKVIANNSWFSSKDFINPIPIIHHHKFHPNLYSLKNKSFC